MDLTTLQDKLRTQVENEYNMWYNHIRDERDRKRDILEKVLPTDIPEWQVRINLLWKNIKLENSLFLTDDINVVFNSEDWVLWEEVMKNASLAAKFDYEDMDMDEMDEDIVNQNALYWVAVSVIDGWDNDEKQPTADVMDSLSIIPDPLNWKGSKMRFLWIERKVTIEFLENWPYKKIDEVIAWLTFEQQRNERSRNDANWTVYQNNDENIYNIYDHYTVYDWKKWLTTWANNRTLLIRAVEIEPLTNAEKLKPNKIKFPFQIHRRSPKYWSFFGVSIADEILNYQDAISILTNLQLIQAKIAALWPDKFVDQNLWIDTSLLWQTQPWGRVIPVTTKTWNIWASFYNDLPVNPSQFPIQMRQEIKQLSEETAWTPSLAFWQSIWWSQTKAEVQTLMQNTNQLLNYIASNYMKWKKQFWEAWYRSYALNMAKGAKKLVSMYQNWKTLSKELVKTDFIKDWKVQVYIESKNQKNAKNEKDFAKLISIANLYLWNMKPWYAMNQFLRKMWDLLWIDNFYPEEYIQTTVDEEKARANLELLNNNYEISPPEAWEDFKTYIDIYKQAIDTPAKRKALSQYQQAYLTMWWDMAMQQMGQTDSTSSAMAMNTVNSQLSQQTPSTEQVSM